MQITLFYESDDGKVLEIGYNGVDRDDYFEKMDFNSKVIAAREIERCIVAFKKDLFENGS